MYHSKNTILISLLGCLLLGLAACSSDSSQKNSPPPTPYKPIYKAPTIAKNLSDYAYLYQKDINYVNDFRLTRLAPDFYDNEVLESTLNVPSKAVNSNQITAHFYPLELDTTEQYQYIHDYKCVYDPENYRYADVAYPNPCMTNGAKAKAKVVLTNNSNQTKTIHCRMFFQNTSYWFPTNENANFASRQFLDNYYGGSNKNAVTLVAGESKAIFLEYIIGQNSKGNEWATKNFYGPARPGNYEFALWTTEDANDALVQDSVDYNQINPFAYIQEKNAWSQAAYVHSTHFKFVFLKETFDGENIYKKGDLYVMGHHDEKPLCDTCTGYFKDVIADEWTTDDFFNGFIKQAPWVKAEYGNRQENVMFSDTGIILKIPGSTETKKQKTWGEVKFGPSFLYGKVTVLAKFPQLRNDATHTPTGIVHNLWLYQFNHPYADPIAGHPYESMVNDKGKQPYEIDIEMWSKIYDENWGGGSLINYSIVDYMRDANVNIKPGDLINVPVTNSTTTTVDRLNNRQLNYVHPTLLGRDFFEQYHLYEILWTPHHVIYKVDGEQFAYINWEMAKIPDQYCFLWIGCPIYQDGTYYSQNSIPFFPRDQFAHIAYMAVE